jgi:2',3'-cyclic-nucleotide 2'-phosphodiesterase (5'-nucleotidase family)
MRPVRSGVCLALAVIVSCGGASVRRDGGDRVTISIVGTNDLHGHLRALPLLGGYLANLRRARAADGGAVVLLDGGDMFQGTLESNLEEGAGVVRAYEALGYDAVAIGNHEFDYGPVGDRATAAQPGDDPRGALLARIAEARFPFLSANLRQRASGEPAPIGERSVMLERAGITIGVIGATTESTPATTIAANVADLAMAPIAESIATEARALRARGARVVIVTAHAGGDCEAFEDPEDLTSCDADEEIFHAARALPPGLVDVIVGGHTHQGLAHRVAGIAIVHAYAYGVALSRIDLTIDRGAGRIVEQKIHPPRRLCSTIDVSPEGPLEACAPPDYEGAPVAPDPAIDAVIAPPLAQAAERRERRLGPTLGAPFPAVWESECPLGNLFTDLMIRARPDADAAIVNGGGLRATLPAGPLTYGALYQAFPFDNRFAAIRLTGAELTAIFERELADDGGFMSISGVNVAARCDGARLAVTLSRPDGRAIADHETLLLLASDFLATGGDGVLEAVRQRQGAITIEEDPPIREEIARVLGTLDGQQLEPATYFDPARPRVAFPPPRPVRCPPAPL